MDRTAMLTNKPTAVWFLIVLVLSMPAAGDEVRLYGLREGAITLTPGPFSGPLTRIVWKHGDDKAIEWEGGQPDAYRYFKGSTFLDIKTGEMMITKLDPIFNGVYSSNVNGIQATKEWKLTVLDPVPKPSIVKVCNESTCELSCKNEATVEVQYAWRKGEEELQEYKRTLVLEKTDDKVGKAYICNISNPVSFAVSDPVFPFRETPVGLVVGLSCGLYILAGVITFIFREKLMESVQTCCGTRDDKAAPLNQNAAIKMELMRTSQDDKAAPLNPDTTNRDKAPNST